jgi:hypothetical protein
MKDIHSVVAQCSISHRIGWITWSHIHLFYLYVPTDFKLTHFYSLFLSWGKNVDLCDCVPSPFNFFWMNWLILMKFDMNVVPLETISTLYFLISCVNNTNMAYAQTCEGGETCHSYWFQKWHFLIELRLWWR